MTAAAQALALPTARDEDERQYRVLPHNVEAEQALLGAILVNNKAYAAVADFLRPEHFAHGVHARLFEAMGKLIDAGQTANPVMLKNVFDQDGSLTEIGGAAYLVGLARSCITVVNAPEYGRSIHDLFVRRELIAAAQEAEDAAYRFDGVDKTGLDLVHDVEEKLQAISETKERQSRTHRVGASAQAAVAQTEAAWRNGGRAGGVTTGVDDLDAVTGGLHPSDLIIVAGRPSMGKTALAGTIAYAAAEQSAARALAEQRPPKHVAFYSLEMSHEQLAQRLMARRTAIAVEAQRNGKVNENDMDRLFEAASSLNDLPLVIDDTPALSVPQIRRHARRLKSRQGLALVIVDYLQLVTASKEARRYGPVAETTEISRQLKELAKELEVPVVALSQLSRQVEQREDKRPNLADLRQSGSIEQDADVVVFVYREEYYLSRAEPQRRADEPEEKFNDRFERHHARLDEVRGVAEAIYAKNRHGRISTVRCVFDGIRQQFLDLSRREDVR